jgi:hypothetical protein
MALRIENERCMVCLARAVCWWTSPPPRRLCRACHLALFDEDPES